MLIIDSRPIAELIRQGANIRSLCNELDRRGKWHSDISAEILKSIGEAVIMASKANNRYMAQRQA